MALSSGTHVQLAKKFFHHFVDRIFTTFFARLFTKLFDVTSATRTTLACIARATPINSLAT
jgi:hypothetical protein